MVDRAEIVLLETKTSTGVGFLVASGKLVTALHVVAEFDGYGRMRTDAEGKPLTRGKVVCTYEAESGEPWPEVALFDPSTDPYDLHADWAILTVPDAGDVRIWQVDGAQRDDRGARCWARGFPPDSGDEGAPFHGVLTGVGNRARVSLSDSDEERRVPTHTAFFQEAAAGASETPQGFSGGPVVVGERVVGLVRSYLEAENGRARGGTVNISPIEPIIRELGLPLARGGQGPEGSSPELEAPISDDAEPKAAPSGGPSFIQSFLVGFALLMSLSAIWFGYMLWRFQVESGRPPTGEKLHSSDGERVKNTDDCRFELRSKDGSTLVPESTYLEISRGSSVVDQRRDLKYDCPSELVDVKLWASIGDGSIYAFELELEPDTSQRPQLRLSEANKQPSLDLTQPTITACDGRYVCLEPLEHGRCRSAVCEELSSSERDTDATDPPRDAPEKAIKRGSGRPEEDEQPSAAELALEEFGEPGGGGGREQCTGITNCFALFLGCSGLWSCTEQGRVGGCIQGGCFED